MKYFDAFRSDELWVNHIVNDTVPKPDQVLCVTKEVNIWSDVMKSTTFE